MKTKESPSVQPDKEETTIEDGIIPDITEVDIQEQFLIPNAINEEAYRKIKKNSHQLVWACGAEIVTRLKQFFASVLTTQRRKMRYLLCF